MVKTIRFKQLFDINLSDQGELYYNNQIVNPIINKQGYYECIIPFEGINYHVNVHLEMFKAFKQNSIPKGYVIHHRDGNRLNNHIDNLILMLRSEHTKIHARNTVDQLTNDQKELLKKYPKLCFRCTAHMLKCSLSTVKAIRKLRLNK